MSPRKRKRTISKSTPAGGSQPSDVKRKGLNACSRCRSLKVKCEVLPGNAACSKCQASGYTECPPQELPKDAGGRGLSAPPEATTHQPQRAQSQSRPPSSMNVIDPPATKRQRTRSASQQSMRKATVAAGPPHLTPRHLAAIPELEDDSVTQDSAIDYDSAGPSVYEADAPNYEANMPNYSPEVLEHANDFFRTLGAADGYGSEESENFDLNVSGIDGEDEDEDSGGGENDISDLSMEALRARLPQATVDNHARSKGIKPPKNVSHQSDNKAPVNYDPDSCPFTIQCITPWPDNSNAPFEIQSTVSLNDLRQAVAEKMDRFPRLIQLQYHVPDIDKAKDGMRPLIVRGVLSSGRLSSRIPKNPAVLFTDASTENGDSSAGKTQASGSSSKQRLGSPSGASQLDGTSRHDELLSQLQEKWKCELHEKGPLSPAYCWVPKDSEYCYPLSASNLTFWVIQIMDGHATIDEKPINLPTQTARRHTKGSSAEPIPQMPRPGNLAGPSMPGFQGFPGGYGYPAPSFNMVLLPWGEVTAPANQPQVAGTQQHMPLSNTILPAHLHAGTSSGSNSQSCSTSPIPMASIPLISDWLTYLDQHPERNQDGVVFALFGPIFKEKGFVCLSQLASKHVSISDLQAWLGVTMGTAISIKDYADEDLEAVRAGKLVIVQTS
ncbi:hypothetical protein BDN67DRAFT_1015315 [Paxillus ammoniavirescens]|nr:hypothetical protein BDN67DRAFT_1015315 [Paxillus ammoniavirescens]